MEFSGAVWFRGVGVDEVVEGLLFRQDVSSCMPAPFSLDVLLCT